MNNDRKPVSRWNWPIPSVGGSGPRGRRPPRGDGVPAAVQAASTGPGRRHRRGPVPLTLALCGLAASVPTSCAAQEVIHRIPDGAVCGACTIEAYRLATIHDREYPDGALVSGGSAHVASDGRFLVLAGPGWSELFLARPDGAIVERIGRTGQGPGEFMDPFSIMETSSAFFVVDPALGRVTELDRDGLTTVATRSFPTHDIIQSPAVFEDGSYVLRANMHTRDQAGYPLHLVSADGTVERSFGAGEEVDVPREEAGPLALAIGGDSVIWVGYDRRYRIEKWDRSGRLVAAYERESEWFSPDGAASPPPGSWTSRLYGLHQDDEGYLWVHISRFVVQEERGRLPPWDREEEFETVVEVIDPERGELVASTVLPGWRAASLTGGFYLAGFAPDHMAQGIIEVRGFRLLR